MHIHIASHYYHSRGYTRISQALEIIITDIQARRCCHGNLDCGYEEEGIGSEIREG